ncbi:DUF2147 domain-containing protein [Bradyrhizobium septentrionale]|uniref:DUF2147 domain-containing protein n=1 Tax=Bradyrhizobium septentrionale TaxID=1404411 RepID=A0A974A2Q9_9BRAD|nr:DUF2147 domain-containing protein [Bradyrhizobium septentrionale]UGY14323.1 DUF2147 domain-containing protein [Bradyrhizobium septentrionale]UGY22971.1 DUF2147 domain-containing protein [Bradyrhizobium septentrionale]
MRKLLAIATLLLASTAEVQAQYTFDYDGRTIRIDPDRGTVSIPGVYDNTPRRTKRAKGEDTGQKRKPAPAEAKTDAKTAPTTNPQPAPGAPPAAAAPAPAAVDQAAAPAAPTPATPTDPATTSVAATPPPAAAATTPPPPAPPVVPQNSVAPAARPAAAPTVGAVAPTAPKPAAVPAQAANSPLGVWLTEEKEGNVRIEQCGANLCGYAVDKKSNANGEQILISMKPGKDKWSGRIFDPSSGSTYDSTIAMKSPDTLRVQGCAFGGMFCGGQTWTRVN